MTNPVIKVEGLGKRYYLSHQAAGRRPRYHRFSDAVMSAVKAPFRRRDSTSDSNSAREEFWALNDVSFEIERGDVVGIIGRNGAGKSTLLKILSRITEPTTGRIEIDGRVASLLEVGTGFHPELTGRENIFLNGAILGMTQSEIRQRFDEIVAFAEVEKFLDTPVKHFSSGMYVRLAFAVAAHLEPEILIVDEVLAVGDAEFQKKCLGKMGEVSQREGRTVLFVSHNITAILNLCSKGIVLKDGRVVMVGNTADACAQYASSARYSSASRRSHGFLQTLSLVSANGDPATSVNEDDSLAFRCEVNIPEERCLVSLILRDARNNPLCEFFDNSFSPIVSNQGAASILIKAGYLPLAPGRYAVDFWLGDRMYQRLERLDGILEFEVVSSRQSDTSQQLNGTLRCNSTWTNE